MEANLSSQFPKPRGKLSQECEGCYSSTLIPVIFGMKCPIIACVQSPCVQIHLASSNIMCVWLRRNLSWSVLPSPDKQSSVCAFVCETKHGNTVWGKKKIHRDRERGQKTVGSKAKQQTQNHWSQADNWWQTLLKLQWPEWHTWHHQAHWIQIGLAQDAAVALQNSGAQTLSQRDGDKVTAKVTLTSWLELTEPNLNQRRHLANNPRRDKTQRAGESRWVEEQERWKKHGESVKWKEKEGGMIKTDWKWEHLIPPLSMCALLCHSETKVNRPAFCLCSFSNPPLRAASLQSLQQHCRQFVFLPTQGFFPPPFLFFLLLNQHFSSKCSTSLQSGRV